jgi:hypothetical protein
MSTSTSTVLVWFQRGMYCISIRTTIAMDSVTAAVRKFEPTMNNTILKMREVVLAYSDVFERRRRRRSICTVMTTSRAPEVAK